MSGARRVSRTRRRERGLQLSPSEWHRRFLQQARWTRDLRRYFYDRIGLDHAVRILDVGCGTGALLAELTAKTRAKVHGLDLNPSYIQLSRLNATSSFLSTGNALRLPYKPQVFDAALCHFVLLWVRDPLQVLLEMARVTRPGGVVLALAEPDYGSRIDFPPGLSQVGEWQRQSLERQGADPDRGRQLAGLFTAAGLFEAEWGVLGGQWSRQSLVDEFESEWLVLESDLAGSVADEQIDRQRRKDWEARQRGERVLFVPTFFAMGRVGGK